MKQVQLAVKYMKAYLNSVVGSYKLLRLQYNFLPIRPKF